MTVDVVIGLVLAAMTLWALKLAVRGDRADAEVLELEDARDGALDLLGAYITSRDGRETGFIPTVDLEAFYAGELEAHVDVRPEGVYITISGPPEPAESEEA